MAGSAPTALADRNDEFIGAGDDLMGGGADLDLDAGDAADLDADLDEDV